jgi:hypothetical protein
MKIQLDENLPGSLAVALVALCHEADTGRRPLGRQGVLICPGRRLALPDQPLQLVVVSGDAHP